MSHRHPPRRFSAVFMAVVAMACLAGTSLADDAATPVPSAPPPAAPAVGESVAQEAQQGAGSEVARAPRSGRRNAWTWSNRSRSHGSPRDASVRSFGASVRGALDVPRGPTPAARSLTTNQLALSRIEPLEEKVASLGPAAPAVLRALAHADLGNALASRQLDTAAAAEYLAAMEADSSFAPAWNNLASLLRRRGELGLAERAIRIVLDLEPRNGLAWFNQALIHEARADLDEADEAYLRALELQPSLWLPSQNPLIIGNRRAQLALLRNYMAHGGARGGMLVDPNPPIAPTTPGQ